MKNINIKFEHEKNQKKLEVCLVDCNRCYNIIVIPMV